MQEISRKEAKSRGLKQYFTGEPCIHGHLEPRHIASFGCLGCVRVQRKKHSTRRNKYNRQWRANHLKKARKWGRKHYAVNRERMLAYAKAWQRANPEKVKGIQKRTTLKNSHKIKLAQAKWRKAHRKERSESFKRWYTANYKRAHERHLHWYFNGTTNPTGELQWLRKNAIQLRNVRRALRNLGASQSPSGALPPAHTSPS